MQRQHLGLSLGTVNGAPKTGLAQQAVAMVVSQQLCPESKAAAVLERRRGPILNSVLALGV